MRKSLLKTVVAGILTATAMLAFSVPVAAATDYTKFTAKNGTFGTDGTADLSICDADKSFCTFGDSDNYVSLYADKYDSNNKRMKVYGAGDAKITIKVSKASVVEFKGYTSSNGTARTVKNISDSKLSFDPSSGFSGNTTAETLTATASEAGTYTFTFSGNVQLTGLKLTEKASSSSGVVTLTVNGGENGSASVKVNDEALVSGNTYAGDSDVVLTVTPDENCVASLTVNGTAATLTNGSYTKKINGDLALAVTFTKNTIRSDITESLSVTLKKGESGFGKVGEVITEEHYFTLGSGVGIGSDYVTVSGADENSVTFKTGDLENKTAKIKVKFASGSNGSEREMALYKGTEQFASFGKSSVKDLVESAEVEIEGNTEYIIRSVASNMYLSDVVITVEEAAEEETFLAGVLDKKPAVAKVNGKYYAILPISEDAADSKTSLKVAGEEAEYIYQNVSITGLNKSAAADFGGSYVYGIEVVPAASGATTEPTLAQVQDAVTVAFS